MYSSTLSLIYPFNEHIVCSFMYQARKKNDTHVSVVSMILAKFLKIKKKFGKILETQS